ncbi:heparanase isoform X3 [Heterocephalus glaber]|uniref:Heparanase n=1 Tax=Heterocephalus glaber TaxID=10181 RepID=A0AAX6S959_HETGA|nr:heparanase isoform X3 [Heterocephalus glaber]
MPPPLLLFLLLLRPIGPAQAGDEVPLDLVTERPLRSVSPAFLSFTIDANLATDPRFLAFLGSPRLRTLARGLAPAYLRFGGTKTDFLIFDPKREPTFEERSCWRSQVNQDFCKSRSLPSNVEKRLRLEWPFQEKLLLKEQYQKKFNTTTYSRSSVDMLYSFANCSGLNLIFGLNELLRTADSQWDSSNAQLLLDYCSSKGYNISWELGNEPNSFRKKAGIFIDGLQLGKDFIELHKLLQNSSFKNAKLYGPDVGQPRGKTVKMLQSFLQTGGEVVDSITWHHYYVNGRIATKEDFLNPDVLDTFIVSVQKILQVVEETRPGKKVWLGETSSAYGGGARLLSNTFAAGFIPRYKEGDLTLYALNLYNVTKHLQLPHHLFNKEVNKYLLKPSGRDGLLSKSVRLNGQTLRMVDDQTLPALTEKSLRPGSSLGLPAFSYGFFVIKNAKVTACL